MTKRAEWGWPEMQVDLEAGHYSQNLMSCLDDSHFPCSQRVLRAEGLYNLFTWHASSTIEERNAILRMP